MSQFFLIGYIVAHASLKSSLTFFLFLFQVDYLDVLLLQKEMKIEWVFLERTIKTNTVMFLRSLGEQVNLVAVKIMITVFCWLWRMMIAEITVLGE